MKYTTEDQVQLEILEAAYVQFRDNGHYQQKIETGAKVLQIINKTVLRTLVNNEHPYNEKGDGGDDTLIYTEFPVPLLAEGEHRRGFQLTLSLCENSALTKEITDVLVRHFGAEGIRLAAKKGANDATA